LMLELLDSDAERGLLIATWIIELREADAVHTVPSWTQRETRDLVDAFRSSLERHGESLSGVRRRRLNQWLERHAGGKR
jgi:hypothetical protein